MKRTPLTTGPDRDREPCSGVIGLTAPATAAPTAPTSRPPAARPVDPIAHDPTIVKEKGWYYVAITGDAAFDDTYLPLKRSRDLVHWEELGPAITELPAWVLESLGVTPENAPRDAWAPDLSWSGTEWRLYYAVSQFGTNNSVIGLLTSPTLANAQWEDRGLVVRSQPGVDTFNAIDPNLVTDADGGTWLSWGSFFSGIHVVPVDDATGKPVAGEQPVRIAQRQFAPNAEENPTIAFHDGYYYLFVSWDYCCRSVESDYRTIVGRSPSLTGPYVDADGVPLLDAKGGTEILRGYNEFVGAGGGDLLMDKNGRSGLFVNHYYDATDGGAPRLNVRTLTWGRDGWPVISDPINPSRSIGHGDAFVQIVPRDGTAVVENAGCGYEGANIALWLDLDNACQQWQLSDRGNGTRILNRFSNNVAEVGACQNVDGGERRAVGLARVPAEQRLPALELRGGGRRLDDGRERAARQPRLDGAGRPGGGRQRGDQLADGRGGAAVPRRAGGRRAAGEPHGRRTGRWAWRAARRSTGRRPATVTLRASRRACVPDVAGRVRARDRRLHRAQRRGRTSGAGRSRASAPT